MKTISSLTTRQEQFMYENIQNLIGLHQELSIIYVVDGYNAILYKSENLDILYEAYGNTVEEALNNCKEGEENLLLWCDSPVYATKSIQPVFDHIREWGYLF